MLRFLRSHLASFTRDGLQQTILFIKLALEELRVAAGSLDDGLTYMDGYGFEHEVDEKFIANLQYLLNTICNSLSQTLARQLKATKNEEANQGDDVRNYRGMAAFPDSCRPISTTWPWTIKPSLAVLWGVCWMFYGDGDSTRVPQERIVNDPDAAQWIGWRRNSDACALHLLRGSRQLLTTAAQISNTAASKFKASKTLSPRLRANSISTRRSLNLHLVLRARLASRTSGTSQISRPLLRHRPRNLCLSVSHPFLAAACDRSHPVYHLKTSIACPNV